VREIVLKLEVDVGRGIVARISKEDLRELDLQTGMEVYITIRASAVHVF
jgi:molybdopterin-binding protein